MTKPRTKITKPATTAILHVPLDDVIVPEDRFREAGDDHVQRMMDWYAATGHWPAIEVGPKDQNGKFPLYQGAARLAAAKKLGHKTIAISVVTLKKSCTPKMYEIAGHITQEDFSQKQKGEMLVEYAKDWATGQGQSVNQVDSIKVDNLPRGFVPAFRKENTVSRTAIYNWCNAARQKEDEVPQTPAQKAAEQKKDAENARKKAANALEQNIEKVDFDDLVGIVRRNIVKMRRAVDRAEEEIEATRKKAATKTTPNNGAAEGVHGQA